MWASRNMSAGVGKVSFDSVGAGADGTTDLSYNITTVADSTYIIVAVSNNRTALTGNTGQATVSVGGVSAPLLGGFRFNNIAQGGLWLYSLRVSSAGTKTVSVTGTTDNGWCSNAVAYYGVASVGSAQTDFGSGTNASITPSGLRTGGMYFGAVGCRSAIFTSSSGGTERYTGASNSALGAAMVVRDATAAVTFSGTISGSRAWAAVAVPLHPA